MSYRANLFATLNPMVDSIVLQGGGNKENDVNGELILRIILIVTAVVGAINGLLLFLGIYLQQTYNGSIEESIDKLNGFRRNYNVRREFWVAVVCITIAIAIATIEK